MTLAVDPDVFAGTLMTLSGSLSAAEKLVGAGQDDALGEILKSCRASVSTLSVLVGGALAAEDDEDEEPDLDPEPMSIATDAPETCGHPKAFELPGQRMCKSCGASENPDGTWSVW